MGIRNYLIEGVSCAGKTSVCKELQRRGYHALNGVRELAYQGDPETGEPVQGITGLAVHEYHIWHVDKVKALVANQDEAVTFFCGGSRNFPKFIDLFDDVFILEVDLNTLNRRLDERPEDGGRGTNGTGTVMGCIERKKKYRKSVLSLTRPYRSRASLTRSSVKVKQSNSHNAGAWSKASGLPGIRPRSDTS